MPDHRCLLCSTNDREGLIEHIAEYTWNSRVERMVEDIPWKNVGATWQTAFREYAVAALQALDVSLFGKGHRYDHGTSGSASYVSL